MSKKLPDVRFLLRLGVGLLSAVLIFGTAAPLVRTHAWWIRIFDFPRIQIAILIGVALAGYVALHVSGALRGVEYGLASALGLALTWQLYSVAPYTEMYPKEMSESEAEDNPNRISLLVYNVLYDNGEVEALRDLIREEDPDIILLSEPTQWWFEQLDGLKVEYPHTLFQPQDNHYGKLLYSKLELIDAEVRFLVESEIPSFRAGVRLRSGAVVTLYGVHPRLPGLASPEDGKAHGAQEVEGEEDERVDSDMRDAELLVIAREIKGRGDQPVIVAGDFNDVAWSRATHLFQRVGGLLDPRVGRGFFNSFSTKSALLRFPLDHVFASEHFRVVELRRLPDIGSDHFPMLVVLDYDPGAVTNEKPQQEAGDEEEADEAIEEGKANHQ